MLGLKSALSLKAKNGNLKVLEISKVDKKTKSFRKSFDKLDIKSVLFVIGSEEGEIELVKIINNIPNIDYIKQIGLNVYDVMNKDQILLLKKQLKKLKIDYNG